MTVKFEDYSMKVKAKLDDATIAFLHEAAAELKSHGIIKWMKVLGLPPSETHRKMPSGKNSERVNMP